MKFRNTIVKLKEQSRSDESVVFTFGDNTISFYKNPLGSIYLKNGDIDDLSFSINGIRKVKRTLDIETDHIKMTFKNGQ
jgi:hypothetical protein